MRFAIKSFPPIGAVQFVIYQACLATSGSEALNEAKSALYPENILPHDTISTNLCTESHHFQQLLTGTTYEGNNHQIQTFTTLALRTLSFASKNGLQWIARKVQCSKQKGNLPLPLHHTTVIYLESGKGVCLRLLLGGGKQ